jgi:tetrapyrrole methylase family protein/MazG family protein
MMRPPRSPRAFDRLIAVMAALRGPRGCPWDRRQTHKSLKPYLIEEAYELIEAIDSGDTARLKGELGDLLLQAVFHAQLAAERGEFTMEDVAAGVAEKLVRRHPHVFSQRSDKSDLSDGSDRSDWEAIKLKEAEHSTRKSALEGVPRGMPALLRSQRILSKAGKARFKWAGKKGAWEKLREELVEFRQAARKTDRRHAEEELGDVLLALANVARYEGFDPEHALHAATDKFMRRFGHIEARLKETGKDLKKTRPAELLALWKEAKKIKR